MLAFTLIGTFAFANNTTAQTELSNKSVNSFETYSIEAPLFSENLVGTCYVTINGYDQDGNLIYSTVLQINGVPSGAACDQIAEKIKKSLSIN
jgi:hypothetical protein